MYKNSSFWQEFYCRKKIVCQKEEGEVKVRGNMWVGIVVLAVVVAFIVHFFGFGAGYVTACLVSGFALAIVYSESRSDTKRFWVDCLLGTFIVGALSPFVTLAITIVSNLII
jgi:hypothetical protein